MSPGQELCAARAVAIDYFSQQYFIVLSWHERETHCLPFFSRFHFWNLLRSPPPKCTQ